jgi:hypothetical protein
MPFRATDQPGLEGLPIPDQILDTLRISLRYARQSLGSPHRPADSGLLLFISRSGRIGFLPSSSCSSSLNEASIPPAARCLRRPVRVSGYGPSSFRKSGWDLGFRDNHFPRPYSTRSRSRDPHRSEPGFSNIGSVTLSGHVTEYRRPRAALEDDQEEAGLVALTKALAIRMPRDSAGVRALPQTIEDPRNPPLESSPFKLAT